MTISRRAFLTYAGLGSYALLRSPRGVAAGASLAPPRRRGNPPGFFRPIAPSRDDRLLLPPGYDAAILCKWDEPLGTRSVRHGPEKFGFNNDFLAYFPIDALQGGVNSHEGLLFVNHEYPDPLFVSGYAAGAKTVEQITAEKLCVGASVLHVKREEGRWRHLPGSRWTRRFTALYPSFALTGPAAPQLPQVVGTLANCSGGRTPWFTALSCEENYQDYNPTGRYQFRWSDVEAERIDERHYGWIVEIDPFGELPPVKHTALGRFAHENAALRLNGPRNKLVVYMGDDARDQYLYKFVSADAYRDGMTRAEKSRLLHQGTLYVADLLECRWRPLDLERSRALRDAGFSSQGEVLVRTREAALALRATPLDRPEDCEVHPRDGSLYVALTNNDRHGNFFGQILRLIEDNDNPEGESFRFEIFLAGGPQSGLACPDNLMFDRQANLWVVCDMPGAHLGRGPYRGLGNNGLHFVATAGASAGDAYQFASGPNECELAGPCFNENEDTLFLSVQHPGEESRPGSITSHWPDGGASTPRPAVVAITGFRR
jgi:secreted PhoX family phosphatase